MRKILSLAMVLVLGIGTLQAADAPKKELKQAPKVVLKSPDGKTTYDLAKLAEDGPVLLRLTCACSGCDQEISYFQKLQAGYNAKGLKTLAVFREKPEAASSYALKKDLRFLWLADPKGALWKTFDTSVMPTNILIDKGGRIVKVVPGCTRDGKNAQLLSAEVARILKTDEVTITKSAKK